MAFNARITRVFFSMLLEVRDDGFGGFFGGEECALSGLICATAIAGGDGWLEYERNVAYCFIVEFFVIFNINFSFI